MGMYWQKAIPDSTPFASPYPLVLHSHNHFPILRSFVLSSCTLLPFKSTCMSFRQIIPGKAGLSISSYRSLLRTELILQPGDDARVKKLRGKACHAARPGSRQREEDKGNWADSLVFGWGSFPCLVRLYI
jgi:hypothetical protein